MSLHYYNILGQRNQFLNSFDRIFDELVAQQFPTLSKEIGISFFEKQSYPKVDVIDAGSEALIEAEIPGMTKDEIKIKVNDDILTISGEKRKTSEDGKIYLKRELKRSSFSRSFRFSDDYDLRSVDAKFENGILTLSVKKKNYEEKKEIEIQIK
jgi:HSP20 family protein